MYLSVKQGDKAAFERNYAQVCCWARANCIPACTAFDPCLVLFACHAHGCCNHACLITTKCGAAPPCSLQLRVYYADARALLPPSDQEASLTALNLLRLLVQVGGGGGRAAEGMGAGCMCVPHVPCCYTYLLHRHCAVHGVHCCAQACPRGTLPSLCCSLPLSRAEPHRRVPHRA